MLKNMYNINIATQKNINNLYRLYQPPQSSYYIVLSLFFLPGLLNLLRGFAPTTSPARSLWAKATQVA